MNINISRRPLMSMVFNCWLVSCLLVTELFSENHFRWKGGKGVEDNSL